MTHDFHKPVLLHEAIEHLCVRPGRHYIDATLGGGGHTIGIIRSGGAVLGIDQDIAALYSARIKLLETLPAGYTGCYVLAKGNFRDMAQIAHTHGFDQVNGIIMDVGMSSYQLDKSLRGFSFRRNELLDMRMDVSSPKTAADVLNSYSVDELYEVFLHFGETHLARKLADRIADARRVKPFTTTGELIAAVEDVAGNRERTAKRHPATTVFQALRIEVNDELGNLNKGLAAAVSLLSDGGRLVVISFHSLEDRAVKLFFRNNKELTPITSRPIVASEQEVANNRRARSAKMRVAEKIHT